MKIIDKRVDPIDFQDLNLGDVFREVNGSNIYLCIDSFSTDGNNYFNAINLYTMDYAAFPFSDRIVKLDAELIIS